MPRFDPDALRHRFAAAAQRRGERYVEEERVRVERREPTVVSGRVQGEQEYAVEVSWIGPDEGAVALRCSCPGFSHFGPCKHLWALLLAVGGARRRTGTAAAERAAWRERLAALEKGNAPRALDVRDPARRIVYELDGLETRRAGALVLRVLESRRRLDGRWGASRPLAAEDVGRGAQSELDKSLLRRLRGAPSASEWTPDPTGADLYRLEGDVAREALPLLCDTGRLFWRDDERETDDAPLRWSGDERWHFEARLVEEEEEASLELRGELVRGEDRRPLSEPLALVEEGWVVFPEEVGRYDARGALTLLRQLRLEGPVRAPAKDRDALVDMLRASPAGGWRAMPWLEPPERVAAVPKLLVETELGGSGRNRRIACRLTFDYDGVSVTPDDPRAVLPAGEGRLLQRDERAEREALEALARVGVRLATESDDGSTGHLTRSDVPRIAHLLLERGFEVSAQDAVLRRAAGTTVSVRSGIDWFELQGGVRFGERVAGLPELLAAARGGGRMVTLDDGSVGLLPEDWTRRWSLLDLGERTEDGLRFSRGQGWLLDALLAEREGVDVDEGFERFRAGLRRFRGLEPEEEPASFHGTLRDYQRDGLGRFRFWRELGLGGCLADDMGLGKTVQVLALLESRRGAVRRPSLVVAPRSVVFNWLDEAARFAPGLRVVDYTGPERRARLEHLEEIDLVVTTYGTLRVDAPELADVRFDYAVLDEAQVAKNAASQTSKAARLLRADHRIALSGTPVENHLGELWALLEFLNPGMLGRSRRFAELVQGGGADTSGLAEALRPFFLRRTKEDVLDDLPDKTEQVLWCDLGETERRRYDELREHYRDELLGRVEAEGLGRTRMHVLEALLRLRQCACHPGLMAPELSGETSAKLDALLPRLEETVEEGRKALVFSQFTTLLGILRTKLDAAGIVYEVLDGRTRKRKERVERFQNDPDCPVFLVSLRAGGHGLNLTAADSVYLLDPWWNPAVEAQAIDRAHRIGRRRPVFAWRLIARDTVEERVLELQQKKRELAEALFEGGGGALRDLTREDLEVLFS